MKCNIHISNYDNTGYSSALVIYIFVSVERWQHMYDNIFSLIVPKN
jgi:hypothetical protein